MTTFKEQKVNYSTCKENRKNNNDRVINNNEGKLVIPNIYSPERMNSGYGMLQL